MGIITQRRKKRRTARMTKRLIAIAGCALALSALFLMMGEQMDGFTKDMQVFSQKKQTELMLEAYDVYALQLAVFDSGERAAKELESLQSRGVHCVIWQQERMRIVADAAFSREALNPDAAKGHDAYVICDTLPAVSLRLSADAAGIERAMQLLQTPDRAFRALKQGDKTVREITASVSAFAKTAIGEHPENLLYTQLAQSLINWSTMMEKTLENADESEARSYGAVTMCTLCRELRQALSAQSTASAQRTPSTAADVMPPA